MSSSDPPIPPALPPAADSGRDGGDWLNTRWDAPAPRSSAADANAVTAVVASRDSLRSRSSGRGMRSWVAFITGTEDGESEELRHLLRPRLLVGVILALLGEVTYLVLYFVTDFITPNPTMLTVRTVVALGYAGALLWLRLRPHLSLMSLRGIELFVVGSLATEFAFNDYFVFLDAWVDLAGQPDTLVRFTYAYCCLNWTCLMFAYAVIIPNTPRRSTAVLGALALMPFVIAVLAWINVPETAQRSLAPLLLYLLRFMLIGFVAALYGSYRIGRLRQEAFEAKRLGQYQLKELLGEGGMGAVWLAEHRLLKRPCAVKLIRPEQAGDPAQLRRFEREVKAMAGLSHWNTAEIFDYGRTPDGAFYYVMEYIRGLSLYELVKRFGPVPPGRAIFILRQLCAALREAHGQGLTHRDIKPSNVMLTRVGQLGDVAKLLDFGLVQGTDLSAAEQRLTAKGIILGTPDYISPEQASGTTECDGRSDIYALGALAYWLLTGQPPFVRATLIDVFFAHMHETPVPPSKLRILPSDLEAVVLQCLAKGPADRFATVEVLDAALARCAAASAWTEKEAEAWWLEYGTELKPPLALFEPEELGPQNKTTEETRS
ncbi:MAG TPA: serine/threonine-protein kinase [Gemmatales bacterium]|nr:serine/threonine-protein kinase [Gemmatales bacterium]